MRNVNVAERSWSADKVNGPRSESAKRAMAGDPVSAAFLSYSNYTFVPEGDF